MKSLKLSPIIVLLFSLTPEVSADCKSFAPSGTYRTETGGGSQRISPGFVCDVPKTNYIDPKPSDQRCNASSECPTKSWGTINGIGYTNLSLTEEQALPLYSLIPNSTPSKPTTFLYSLSDTAPNITSCMKVRNGTAKSIPAGWWAFTPILRCIEGTLSQCTDGPVADGTAIKVCAVDTYGSDVNNPGLNGVSTFVVSDAETAANLTTNPAATASAVDREPSASPTSTAGTNAAGKLSEGGLVSALVALGVWIVI